MIQHPFDLAFVASKRFKLQFDRIRNIYVLRGIKLMPARVSIKKMGTIVPKGFRRFADPPKDRPSYGEPSRQSLHEMPTGSLHMVPHIIVRIMP